MHSFFPRVKAIGRRRPPFSRRSIKSLILTSTRARLLKTQNAPGFSRRRTTGSRARGSDRGGAVFCNPPYSKRTKDKPGQEDWIRKAAEEGAKPGAVVVMLLPARTDTAAFHRYIYKRSEIRFIKGRLRFHADGQPGNSAPFPSMVVIFRGPEVRK